MLSTGILFVPGFACPETGSISCAYASQLATCPLRNTATCDPLGLDQLAHALRQIYGESPARIFGTSFSQAETFLTPSSTSWVSDLTHSLKMEKKFPSARFPKLKIRDQNLEGQLNEPRQSRAAMVFIASRIENFHEHFSARAALSC